jgi:CHAT domain-containing protein/tetratricopeptide (TPR) repeat protein
VEAEAMAVALLLGGVYVAGRVEVKMTSKTIQRFVQQTCLVMAVLLCVQPVGHAGGLVNQAEGEVKQLEVGRVVEREIAGGESHHYQIQLSVGEFVRFRAEQQSLDSALILTAPDGKQLVEMDMTGAGEPESLSIEAVSTGSYRVTVRGAGAGVLSGSYRLEAAVQQMAMAPDRQRLTAEGLLIEAKALSKQGSDASQQVIEKCEQALKVWRELGEPSWIASALNLIGDAYDDSDESEKAIEYYQQVLDICRDHGLRRREALTLCGIGLSYRALGQVEKEAACFEQALTISRELKDRVGEAHALLLLSVAYYGLDAEEKAIEVCEQALTISREVKDRLREVNALNNLAAFYGSLHRADKEIEYLEQALTINRVVKDQKSQHQSLHNLGAIFHQQGEDEKAISYYEQAIAIARELKNREREEATLGAAGGSYLALKQYEKAISYYEQALAIALEMKDRWSEGHDLRVLGVAFASMGQPDKAIHYLDQALAISRENNSLIYQLYTLADLARTENERGNLAQARAHIEECLGIAEVLRARKDSFATRAAFFTSVQRSYQLYTDILMRQHKGEPAGGLDALAVEVSERQRARSLLDMLIEARADLRQGVDAALLEQERTLIKQLGDKAQAQAKTPEAAAALKLEISKLESDLERAQVAIRKASPRYAALTQPQPLKFKEIQQLLDDDTLLLEYALSEDRSYLWAITKDSVTNYQLPKGELIDKDARRVYELLTERGRSKGGELAQERQARISQAETALAAAAEALSQTLLAPVAALLGNKRLVIVADGALQYIPFAMLPDPNSSKVGERLSGNTANPQSAIHNPQSRVGNSQSSVRNPQLPVPLIVNHEVVSLPSASALAIQRTELAGRQPAPKMLAVIADPVFDRTDLRFKRAATDANTREQSQTLAVNDTRSLEHLADKSYDKAGPTIRRLVIPRLPFTRQEATRLLALTPKSSSFGAIDFQANRETVLKGELSQYRYVHFATHGLLDTERPGLSALVLSMIDAQGNSQNGFLRANDIYNLKLPAELVVLSACQTGLGKEIKGEGLIGLTRGFMYAGAARVVVSLWNVNDKATAELMTKFYERMLKQGERPAGALRAAQVEMWKQKRWQSPYYWAAFTMQGEWR